MCVWRTLLTRRLYVWTGESCSEADADFAHDMIEELAESEEGWYDVEIVKVSEEPVRFMERFAPVVRTHAS